MSDPCSAVVGKAASRRSLQVLEYKENQNIPYVALRPIPRTLLEKTVKKHLATFSLSNDKLDQFKRPRYVLEEEKSINVMLGKKMERNKTCRGILTLKMETAATGAGSTLQLTPLDAYSESKKSQCKSASEAAVLSEDGESDDDAPADLDDFSGLSPYERKRLKNISENANFFASLQLSESAARLREIIEKRQPESKRKKPKKREIEIGCRRSMRLLKVDPPGVSAVAAATQSALEEENTLLPSGPFEMTPDNQGDDSELFKGFLQTWTAMGKTSSKTTKESSNLESYQANLSGMVISEDNICKVTSGAVFSVALHPSETRTLVAAGAKFGQIGLWDLSQQPKEDGVYVFQPHSRPVSCLYFSPANPAHILSLSYDGTVRCGDFSTAVFDEVYRDDSSAFSSFDFLAEDACTLVVGHWEGNVSIVDRRTPGTSHEKFIQCSLEKIRTVHVHPVHRQYFVTAGSRDVHIYDVRNLTPRGSQPLVSLTQHTRSLASAYFSALTGNRILTTCADSNLRIFDSSCLTAQLPLLTTIRHDTNSGRWLTRFQAIWDPKQEDCVVVGSMAYPRRVEVFHETGKRLHSFLGESLASVCSINAMHPTRFILAGGNSSGKIHVFMNQNDAGCLV
ncbi:WD repeat-containing protein 76 [Tenrec ecaudatus]|uniref:WD repeat-containing protein 76 n=1 Tax=Tenrec ecaudatus TaxID=94439 RepID=UPI003F597527